MNFLYPIQEMHPFWRTFLGGLLFALISALAADLASAVARIKIPKWSGAPQG
ncbi:hypothetical protein [Methylococcus geothermalis]|uniref:Uncharacterized protein n=1 Tax=Methylococcus geothermalis TaxID=2681310 RepID=A0A858Q4H2_9GAMM|nr:hypothetical protein [Methylococcus geothermalis]QJD28721.1 hypothetical protein GNH96_01200 [Methylococcus geothermalis]